MVIHSQCFYASRYFNLLAGNFWNSVCQILEKTAFYEAAGLLPRQYCCLQSSVCTVPALWNLRNSVCPPASSSSVPFFFLSPASNCEGISSSISTQMSTGNMLCFVGVFLWSEIWIGFSWLHLSITPLYFIIHFFKTVGSGKFPGNL